MGVFTFPSARESAFEEVRIRYVRPALDLEMGKSLEKEDDKDETLRLREDRLKDLIPLQ